MDNTGAHAALMDSTYRYQRLFYDITRRYYLLGRDRMVAELKPPKGGRVLEIACGTGRNLAQIGRMYPDCALFGLDISQQMLISAEAKMRGRARLVQANACDFDGDALFGPGGFDRVVLSYSLSMIPDWEGALGMAVAQLRPGGELHVVDFGGQNGLPPWFSRLLHAWLARFHVVPRADLRERMQALADERGLELQFQLLYRDYARCGVLRRGRDQ